jgi:biotin carboxyl carrier protein
MSAHPPRHVKVIVNGNAYDVEVGDLSATPMTVTVNGTEYQVEVSEDRHEAAAAPPVAAVRRAAPTVMPVAAPPIPVLSAGCSGAIRAPMPGNIVDVAVQVGDPVTLGQTVCALEAMKMKSAIRSPRAGVVSSVAVRAGQPVAYGDVLLVVE